MPAGAEHQMIDEVDADECRGGRQAARERQVLPAPQQGGASGALGAGVAGAATVLPSGKSASILRSSGLRWLGRDFSAISTKSTGSRLEHAAERQEVLHLEVQPSAPAGGR
jgi:hypothetical protein